MIQIALIALTGGIKTFLPRASESNNGVSNGHRCKNEDSSACEVGGTIAGFDLQISVMVLCCNCTEDLVIGSK